MSVAEYGSLKFSESISFFRNKLNLPSERWADVWQAQNNAAFHVAGATKTELIADLRSMVDAAIAEGKSLTWFKSEFKHLVKRHGWDHTGTAAWRANIIYSTNVRQAYNAGRHEQLQTFEFWRYKHGDSLSPRPAHLAKDGTILPKDSPFWRVWFPQNGWGCKCKVFGETRRSLERKGLKVSKEPVIETRQWTDKKTGEVHWVPVGIDPGFDYSPGKVDAATIIKQQQAQKPPLAERLPRRIAPSAYSSVKGADIHGLNRILDKIAVKRPEINALSEFLTKNNIKTLILKPSELPRGSKSGFKLQEPIAEYLNVSLSEVTRRWPVPSNIARRANGYTSARWDHIVLRAKTGTRFSNVDNVDELINAADAVIALHRENHSAWSVSSIVRKFGQSGDDGGAIITWLHEMGHQVHYKAMQRGIPAPGLSTAITTYSGQDIWEWHAEHFVIWLLARKNLLGSHPDIAEYFDKMMERLNE